jgi:FtsP/CotA-like multicopper oxidase with cupredoxin domain
MRATRLAPPLAAAFALVLAPRGTSVTATSKIGDEIRANDNRVPAGRFGSRVLAIRLEAREGVWFPETRAGPGIPVYAFAEEGRPLQIPGPLIRVPAGTEIRATVRNALPKPMRLRGLQDRQAALLDTIDIAPGATREIRFRADAPGTYYYWARTEGNLDSLSTSTDSQLLGAFIVDPAGTAPIAGERVMVMTLWVDPQAAAGGPEEAARQAVVVNGLSWPYTERLRYAVGDTVRWRLINGTVRLHPMRLHGFFFRVDGRGDATRDTVYTAPQRRRAATAFMSRGTTMAATWVPTRPGTWLFHGHAPDAVTMEIVAIGGLPGTRKPRQ